MLTWNHLQLRVYLPIFLLITKTVGSFKAEFPFPLHSVIHCFHTAMLQEVLLRQLPAEESALTALFLIPLWS